MCENRASGPSFNIGAAKTLVASKPSLFSLTRSPHRPSFRAPVARSERCTRWNWIPWVYCMCLWLLAYSKRTTKCLLFFIDPIWRNHWLPFGFLFPFWFPSVPKCALASLCSTTNIPSKGSGKLDQHTLQLQRIPATMLQAAQTA